MGATDTNERKGQRMPELTSESKEDHALERASNLPGARARTRLRKLQCSDGCGYIVRVSRATMLRGLPGCPCCPGAVLWPWDVDDVEACALADVLSREQYERHPLVVEYERQRASVLHGQAWKGDAHTVETPDSIALLRVARMVREDAVANQLAAARAQAPAAEPMPF